jgi:hypothetical protein
MHMTFGRLGAVDAAAKISGMEGALPATWRLPHHRYLRLVGTALVIGISVALLIFSLRGIGFEDTASYWGAAERLRAGLPLYPDLHGIDAQFTGSTYLYSPWFAFAWVPLTYLPQPLAIALWELVLVGAGAWLVWGVRDRPLVALFFGVLLFDTISEGNVQTLMVAWLVFGLERRSGPVWVALAASLKAFPILLALVYVRRGEWSRFWWTVALTITFTMPMLFFDLSHYPAATSRAPLVGPLLYVPVAVAAVVYAARFVPERWERLAAAAAVVLGMPRFWLYDATMLLVGLRAHEVVVERSIVAAKPKVRRREPQRAGAEQGRKSLTARRP